MRLVATLALFDVYHSSLAPRVQTRRVIAYAKDQWIHGQLQLYAANSLQARYLIPVYLSCPGDFAVSQDKATVVQPDTGSIRSRSILYRVEICETVRPSWINEWVFFSYKGIVCYRSLFVQSDAANLPEN